MDTDTLADLKQFITATISQQTTELHQEIARVEQKIDDVSTSVANALDATHQPPILGSTTTKRALLA